MNNIATNIKRIRNEKGKTQQEIANELFVTRQCVSRWEQGRTLPDINNIKKISKVLDCTLNDLIDEESVLSITLNGTIKSKKMFRIIYGVLGFIILLIFSFAIYYIIDNQTPKVSETIVIYATISEITDSCVLSFEVIIDDESDDIVIDDYNCEIDTTNIRDVTGNRMNVDLFRINDKVKITYWKKNEIEEIQLIDSVVDEELFGFFIVENGVDLDSSFNIDSAIRYYGNNGRNVSVDNVVLIEEEYYTERQVSINITIDPLIMSSMDYKLYKMTSNGPVFIANITPEVYQLSYIISGETLDASKVETKEVHSYNETYIINFMWEFGFKEIVVYEYNANNELIATSALSNLDDLLLFSAHSDSIRCFVEVHTTSTNGEIVLDSLREIDNVNVYELLLGERIQVFATYDNGFVGVKWFVFD